MELITISLIGIICFLSYKIYKKEEKIKLLTDKVNEIPDLIAEESKKASRESLKRSKAVLKGQAAEQIAPYLKDFPFYPGDCRFLGSPIDLIAFVGNTKKNVEKVVFIEIKTGESRLSLRQRQIKEAIQEGQVEWLEYRIPDPEPVNKLTHEILVDKIYEMEDEV